MRSVTAIVIGAGHAGLAISHELAERSIDHTVLERGEVANSWKTERWDSLRLLTPNWQSQLPGHGYEGDDPDGFMAVPEVVDFIEAYAAATSAPIETHTKVTSVAAAEGGYRVETGEGVWQAPTVVLASGGFNVAHVPAVADALPLEIAQLTPMEYRGPDQLEEGGVLVVGASATGIQLADEIHRSGRPVTLAVGEHVRMPRVYRGRDIQWWMDRAGLLDERYDEVDDLTRARNVPSPQLVGTPERATLDFNALTEAGVKLVGRFAGVNGDVAQFSGSLRNVCALADLKLGRLLGRFDEWATEAGADTDLPEPHRFDPTEVEDSPALTIDMAARNTKTVVWATGFKPDYSWLDVPVLDRKAQVRHEGGVVTDAPGMYLMGLNFLRRRKSSFIHGAGDDARDLSDHLARYLAGRGTNGR
ncbi:MAG: NAD(P)-binding domain-containing protein [Gaiellaceae bacterium]